MTDDAKTLTRPVKHIGMMTALSRFLGFIRDILLATVLGTGIVADAFFVAFRLPNLFRNLTAEGAMTSAFLPNYTRLDEIQNQESAQTLAAEIQVILLWVLVGVVIIFEIIMPFIIIGIAPGFARSHERLADAVNMARLTMPFLPMVSLVALWVAIANAHNRFMLGAAIPAVMNLVLIITALIAHAADIEVATKGIVIAASVSVAGGIQLVIIGGWLRRHKVMPKVLFKPRFSADGKSVWRRFWPSAVSAGGTQINLLIDTMLASLLPIGGISVLYYAERVAQLPIGIVGNALGVALLPRLARLEARGTQDEVVAVIARGLIIGMSFGIPAMVGTMLIAREIINGLFVYGAFDASSAERTTATLMAYAVGIPALILIRIFQSAFYAKGDTTTPMRVTMLSVVVNLIASVTLMQVLGVTGLALATSLATWLAVIVLGIFLVRQRRLDARFISPIVRIILATMIMLVVLVLCHQSLKNVDLIVAVELLLLMVAGAAGYALGCALTGVYRYFSINAD